MTYMSDRVAGFGTTIFTEMTALAEQHNAINLGQGFPDFAAPHFLKEAAQEAIAADINQYAPGSGRPALKEAIAHKMRAHYDLAVNPTRQVTVTHGATEAIFATIFSLVNPGDEVILFEPYYDSYVPCVTLAGATPRFYTLQPPDWRIDAQQLADLFTARTRLIVLNTPHNPTGKVYDAAEMAMIAGLCRQHDVLALTDEVYEHILFDDHVHYSMATLPGMAERTVVASSLGKSFSVTGWKVGWAVAPAGLTEAIRRSHQYITFSGAAPLQEAAAAALVSDDAYYRALATMYQEKRDYLVEALTAAGLRPITPHGTYFVMAQIDHLGFADDVAFCRYLTTEIGVAAIPPSAFYANAGDGAGLARFAFCKSQAALEQAADRLQKLASRV